MVEMICNKFKQGKEAYEIFISKFQSVGGISIPYKEEIFWEVDHLIDISESFESKDLKKVRKQVFYYWDVFAFLKYRYGYLTKDGILYCPLEQFFKGTNKKSNVKEIQRDSFIRKELKREKLN